MVANVLILNKFDTSKPAYYDVFSVIFKFSLYIFSEVTFNGGRGIIMCILMK
jgi:hypothetical protein